MEELARHYYGFILAMVRKCGIPDQEAPDSVQYILERLGKTNVLGQFDPGHVTEHQGSLVRTRFSTFLGAKVMRYCLGERSRLARRSGHELLVLDAPSGSDGDGELSPADVLGMGVVFDDYSGVETAELLAGIRAHLAQVPPRSSRDTCDLVALFDEIVAEINQDGAFSYAGIQARFGVSGTTAGSWLSRLRQVLNPALDRPVLTAGGVALSAEQVADAVKVLRAAPGIMVAQPLARAGHPLAKAAKGWYHGFAREEIAKFPVLAEQPGTHRKPAGHVKSAVIHRLERVLTESGVEVPALAIVQQVPDCDPEPPVTPEEELEAALWRGVRDAADLERVKALARRAYAVSA